jgi:hypothetical protein
MCLRANFDVIGKRISLTFSGNLTTILTLSSPEPRHLSTEVTAPYIKNVAKFLEDFQIYYILLQLK